MILIIMLVTSGCASQKSGKDDPRMKQFQYDAKKAFNVEELSTTTTEDGITVSEISYDSYDVKSSLTGKTTAYLVVPQGEGPFPTVLYVHWLGNINGNKKEFLKEATEMAKQGVAGMLIEGYFPWKKKPGGDFEKDKLLITNQVIELRRALDYMAGLSYVDTKHMAYVGHDYGAMFGAILSGVDPRITNYNLEAGMGNFCDWFFQYWVKLDKEEKALYRQNMLDLDPVTYLATSTTDNYFFQFANKDNFITQAQADEFTGAVTGTKSISRFDAHHDMNLDSIRADRQKWLLDVLEISK